MIGRASFRAVVCLLAGLAAGAAARPAGEKAEKTDKTDKTDKKDDSLSAVYGGMEFRNIGPFRGGRVDAVTGVRGQPLVYYFGGTGGGVWKTADGGSNWRPMSDKDFRTGSVGAIAVAESDPNVVYAGMGEPAIRGNVSHGDGVYKSTDAGKTWVNVGLQDTRQISRVRVHPKDPNLVYVAALGHVWGPNAERGVFRSKDGGKTWEKVLFVIDRTGASTSAWTRPTRASSTPASGRSTASPGRSRSGGTGGRRLQVDRRRRHLEEARGRAARGRRRQHRRRGLGGSPGARLGDRRGRGGRRLSAPTTAARSGRASTRRTSSASAPGTTRRSTPTRRTPTRSTC